MKLGPTLLTIAIAMWVRSLQGVPQPQSSEGPKWQKVDQLCGEVELAGPTKKSIVVNGKTEVRLYSTPVRNAEVALYRATATDKTCCAGSAPVARTRSNKIGVFEFSGFRRGLYWLKVRNGHVEGAIPLRLTDDFRAESCHAPSVERTFVVDARPPTVETRIH
jgi:hypothetical protein